MGEHVLASHFCLYDDANANAKSPRRLITSLAYQISRALPEFEKELQRVRQIDGSLDATTIGADARELAKRLLLDPLNSIRRPEKGVGRMMIIIDGLDEADEDSEFLKLIARDFEKLPPWVALLVTARPELNVQKLLRPLDVTQLDAGMYKANCDADIRLFVRHMLTPLVEPGELDGAISTVVSKIKSHGSESQGSFLYLHHLRDHLKNRGVRFDTDDLSDSLAGWYDDQFDRFLSRRSDFSDPDVMAVLEVIVVSAVLPHITNELPGLSGVPTSKVLNISSTLSKLFPVRDDRRVRIFHKTLVDWLPGTGGYDRTLDGEGAFFIDRDAAQRRIVAACARALMRRFTNSDGDNDARQTLQLLVKGDQNSSREAPYGYALRWMITLLTAAGMLDEAVALLCSYKFIEEGAASDMGALVADRDNAGRLKAARGE